MNKYYLYCYPAENEHGRNRSHRGKSQRSQSQRSRTQTEKRSVLYVFHAWRAVRVFSDGVHVPAVFVRQQIPADPEQRNFARSVVRLFRTAGVFIRFPVFAVFLPFSGARVHRADRGGRAGVHFGSGSALQHRELRGALPVVPAARPIDDSGESRQSGGRDRRIRFIPDPVADLQGRRDGFSVPARAGRTVFADEHRRETSGAGNRRHGARRLCANR